jgi:hypothetical protein
MVSKRSDGSINLVEQETNLLAVVSIVGGLSWTPKMRQVAKVEPCP